MTRARVKAAPARYATIALLALHLTMLAVLAAITPWTTDEPNYLQAGIALRKELHWDVLATVLHGPLTFYGNQLAAWCGVDYGDWEGAKFAARVGMLGWPLLCAGLVFLLARKAYGPRAGVAALLLHVLNPIALAHGCLITSDVALAAGSLLVAWAALRWLESGRLRDGAVTGIALGVALATKYLAVFLLPAAIFAAFVASGNARSRTTGRLAHFGLAMLVLGTTSLVTLHATYGFRAGGYQVRAAQEHPDPNDENAGPLSHAVRRAVAVPLVPQALALVPAPFVRGIDYQMLVGEAAPGIAFGERIGPGFASYYAVALATKLPLGLLLLLPFGLALRGPPRRSHFAVLLLLIGLVPLVYLSGFAKLQLGVRYAMPAVALLAIPAGRGLALLLERPRLRFVGWVALALVAAFAVRSWPRYLGAFNALAGREPWKVFVDSNLDWRADFLPDRDELALRERWPGVVRVWPNGGPRFGRVLVHAADLAAPDPENPGRVHHWLRRLPPADREGAWLAFEVRESDLRAGAETDPRVRVELAIALVGQGVPNAAKEALGDAKGPSADLVREAVRIALSGRVQSPAMRTTLLQLGRSDLVPADDATLPVALRLQALFLERKLAEGMALVEATRRDRPLQLDEALYAAALYDAAGKPEAALTTLDAAAPPRESPVWAKFQEIRTAYEAQARGIRAILARGSGRFVR